MNDALAASTASTRRARRACTGASVLSIDGDTVQLRVLDPGWTEAAAGDGTLPIAHVLRVSEVLLTASSEELREFARVYAIDEEVFDAVTALTRGTSQPAGDR